LNSEFNKLVEVFNKTTGHSHNGTTDGEGPLINLTTSISGFLPSANGGVAGLNNTTATGNPGVNNDLANQGYNVGSIWINVSTDKVFICVDASTGAAIWQEVFALSNNGTQLLPSADNTVDIGSSTLEFKDLHLDGTAKVDILTVDETSTFTGLMTTAAISQTSGTATLSNVDVNAGNIDGTIIGATAAAAITATTIGGTDITASSSFIGDLTGSVDASGSGKTLSGPLTGNVTGNISTTTGTSTFNNVTITGVLDMTSDSNTGNTITNLTAPQNANDAATKSYVDTEIAGLVDSAPGALNTLNELAAAIGDDASFSTTITTSIGTKLPLAGGTLTGDLTLSGAPTSTLHATTKTYVDTNFLSKTDTSAQTMAAAIDMGTHKITSSTTPTNDSDLARKKYVDDKFALAGSASQSATNAAASATAAATSETNAATSASAASTSETNAAASASTASTAVINTQAEAASAVSAKTAAETAKTAAETALDSFDDRYLGSKSSAPSVDNDGNTLLDGALYWDTTLNSLRVYDLGNTAWNTIANAANVATVATNITNVNTFATRYRIQSGEPTSSLDAGDLVFDTAVSKLKVYNGSSWEQGATGLTNILDKTNNLSDLTNAATARTNLGTTDEAVSFAIALG
jgi:hypothetical protein